MARVDSEAEENDTTGPWALEGVLVGHVGNVFAGIVCGILALLVGLSYAALIFSGPLAPWLAYGITATFLSTAIGAFVVALWSSVPFTIAGPGSSTSAVTAVLSLALATKLSASGQGAHLLGPTLILISMGSALAGISLCLLGLTRAARAVRFIPYPVIGGFLGATGVLIVAGAIQVATGIDPTLSNVSTLLADGSANKLLAAAAVAGAVYLGRLRTQNAFLMPVVLILAVVTFYAVLLFKHIPVDAAIDQGWMLRLQPKVSYSLPWNHDAIVHFPWHALPSLAGDLLAVVFVTTISALLSTTGIELATHQEADLNRELNAMGVANLLSAAVGGYVSYTSVSRTVLGFSAGATGRLAGITTAVIATLMLIVSPSYLSFVPKFVLGGVLLFMGLGLIFRWTVESIRHLALIDYVSLLAIVLVIIVWGFIAGVAFGIIVGCATFALSVSRVSAIKFGFDGSHYRSSLDRSAAEFALLASHGQELRGVSLQSYLFFGSASHLFQHVKSLLTETRDCRFLIFDFRLVTGIDSSAIHSFTQIKRAVDQAGATLLLVNLSGPLSAAFRNTGFFTGDIVVQPDLDHALEKCENAIIEAHRGDDAKRDTLVDWLTDALEDRAHAELLAAECSRIDFAAGDIIGRQGDASHGMHFVFEGRVGIIVDMEGRQMRMRSLGPHTIIGEIGLLTGRPRSVSVVAEAPSVLYELHIDAYKRLARDRPFLTEALLTYIIKVMGERLTFSNRAIGILQR